MDVKMVKSCGTFGQMGLSFIHRSSPHYKSLLGLAHDLSEASACVDAGLARTTAKSLSLLVEEVSCYYSNLIEGLHTSPLEIRQARQALSFFQSDLQSQSVAYLAAHQWALVQDMDTNSIVPVISEIHRQLFSRLPSEMLELVNGPIVFPGSLRLSNQEVKVGAHIAPRADHLHDFLRQFASTYGEFIERARQGGIHKLEAIVATVAAHHSLTWIHPFLDGNGRISRIALDAMLHNCTIRGASLWSISRGFAKTDCEYKVALAACDQPRIDGSDGDGYILSEALADFCTYVLKSAIDQILFMAQTLSRDIFRARVEGYFYSLRGDLKPESIFLYLHAFTYGEFHRMEVSRITGLPERTGRNVLNALLAEGFLLSDSPKGKVRAGFPLHALMSLMPNLYPATALAEGIRMAQHF